MIPSLYLLFFLSGAAGLMYESVWTRYLGLFVGHDAYAQVLVLVIFLGGMSLGAALVARRARTIRQPLLVYAVMEGAAGLIGLGFHGAYVAVTGTAYESLLPALAGTPWHGVVTWGIAALLILPQSILLGTTFPLMSAAVLRCRPATPGRVLGWLYFTNSFGAAVGVLVAGFVIVAAAGLPGVLLVAAMLNLVVALAAWLASKRQPDAPAMDPAPAPAAREADGSLDRLLLGAAFFTAVASFCYEIGWIRMLSLVLGSATHSFELMLSAFILGLALGAFWIRRRADTLTDPLRTLAAIQIAMGMLAVATLPVYTASFGGMEWLLRVVGRSSASYGAYTVARYAFCLAVMLPATFCAGMTLPLITRMLLLRGGSEAAIGRVYALNTLGSIVGAAGAGLLLLPLLGLKALGVVGSGLDILVGLALLARVTPRRVLPVAVASAAAVALLVASTRFDQVRLTAGVFRGGRLAITTGREMLLYADGRTATVSVAETQDGFRMLATNGKADASLTRRAREACTATTVRAPVSGDQVTQLLIGLLPLGYHPAPRYAAVIGLGSGVTTHTLLADPGLTEVRTVEIEPRMVDGARLFAPANERTFTDPRSAIVIDDAKSYFAASGRKWDLLISEPSNPWVSGVSGLFTVEFYRRVRAQLASGGVFAQWLQTYELDDDLVLSVLAALHAVFPDWTIHQVGGADLLLVASADGPLRTPDWDRVVALPALATDFCRYLPLDRDALATTHLAGRGFLAPLAGMVAQPNSDFYPTLDLLAERRRFEGQVAGGALALGDDWLRFARRAENDRRPPVPTDAPLFPTLRRPDQQWQQTWQTRPWSGDSALAPRIAQQRYELARWDAVLAADRTPEDWRPWLAHLASVAGTRHAGTSGWVDTLFWGRASAFAARHRAPLEVRATIDFRRAVLAWDDTLTMAATGVLSEPAALRGAWIDGDELRDGAVFAAFRMGRPEVAVYLFDAIAPVARRDRSDLRSRLLAARVEAARHPREPADP